MYDAVLLSTCFDKIEDSKSDQIALDWVCDALDAKLDLARFVARQRGMGPATELVGYLKGSFNLGFRIRCDDDGPDAIIRFPKPGHISTALLEEKIVNEVATMAYIRENTTIPVPMIRGWGLTSESPRQLGPFIIMDFVEGTLASRVIQKPTKDDQEEIVLDPDVDDSLLDKFYRQVSGHLLQLSRLSFDRIGAISKAPEKGTWSVSKRPLTYNMNELATSSGYSTHDFCSGPFACASDFFTNIAQEHLGHLNAQRNIAFGTKVARARIIARHRYMQLIRKYNYAADDAGPLIPYCDDLRPANMLVDPETMEIKAVLDWEFTNAMPAQFSHDPPWWLLLADPASFVDRGALAEFRDLYVPRMEQFLRALTSVEDEDPRADPKEHRLSTRMRRSWETGQFWFDFAARKSYDVDNIYWQVLHEGGNAEELLDPKVRGLIDEFVERKMVQLDQYEKDRDIEFPEKSVDGDG